MVCATAACAKPPAIGHMAPSDVPEMPLSDVVHEYGDWFTQKSSLFFSAQTYSVGGDSMFGLFCGETCSYYTNPGIACRVGDVAAGLVGTSSGTTAVTLRCLHVKEEGQEQQFMVINEDLTDLLADTDRFSIGIPLAGGRTQVDVYSMKGAAQHDRDGDETA